MTICSTTPSPTSSASRRSSWGWSSRSWVAQAVESARTTSTASSKVSTTQWSASWSPTISRHRPTTPPMLTGALQPRSAMSLSTMGPRSWGSRREGAEPLPTSPRPGPGRNLRVPAGGRPGAVRRKPLAAAAARARARAWRAGSGAASSPSAGVRSLTGDLPARHREPGPLELVGDVLRHGRGDEHLLRVGDHRGEPGTAAGVELGEDVVEDEDGTAAVVPEHLVGGEPEGEREGPGLAIAGVAPDGQPAQRVLVLRARP